MSQSVPDLPGGSEHVLLVEDEEGVAESLSQLLEVLGYRVSAVSNGDQAIELVREDPSIEVVLTDMVMPGTVQGTDLATLSRDVQKDLPFIFMSGYPVEVTIAQNGLDPDQLVLSKPFTFPELAQALRMALV